MRVSIRSETPQDPRCHFRYSFHVHSSYQLHQGAFCLSAPHPEGTCRCSVGTKQGNSSCHLCSCRPCLVPQCAQFCCGLPNAIATGYCKWPQSLTCTESAQCSQCPTQAGNTWPRLSAQNIPCTLSPPLNSVSKPYGFGTSLLSDSCWLMMSLPWAASKWTSVSPHRGRGCRHCWAGTSTFLGQLPPPISERKFLLPRPARVALSQLHLGICSPFIIFHCLSSQNWRGW